MALFLFCSVIFYLTPKCISYARFQIISSITIPFFITHEGSLFLYSFFRRRNKARCFYKRLLKNIANGQKTRQSGYSAFAVRCQNPPNQEMGCFWYSDLIMLILHKTFFNFSCQEAVLICQVALFWLYKGDILITSITDCSRKRLHVSG